MEETTRYRRLPTMSPSIDALLRMQERDLERMRRLEAEDPERAKAEARERLLAAGIIDEDGNLAPHYRSDPDDGDEAGDAGGTGGSDAAGRHAQP